MSRPERLQLCRFKRETNGNECPDALPAFDDPVERSRYEAQSRHLVVVLFWIVTAKQQLDDDGQ